MLIDWFTVIAQLLNFLILVWLLKRFLYQPVLKAMDEREKRITARLRDAETQKAEAEKEKGHYHQLNSNLQEQQESLLEHAKADADAERQRLLEAAREDHRLLRSRLHQTLESEKANLSQGIIRRFQKEVFEIARKVLADLADTSLEKQMATVFVRRLEELNDADREQLSAALRSSNHGVAIRSTFPLSPDQQQAIEAAVKKMLPPERTVLFETTIASASGEQADGIQLATDGYKMAWSVADYLSGLEKRVAGILEEELEGEPKMNDHGA
ncbi:MAG: hypothetical protein KDD19_20840 [Phaeodactylibacter sp.]|nr:hypothetical protein [Phaeodactylibacter sp.]MCB9049084.1 F0F1 ATP synthase subunit B [Lewinellaceae bacterium]